MNRLAVTFLILVTLLSCRPAEGGNTSMAAPDSATPSCAAPALSSQAATSSNTLRGRVCEEESGKPVANILITTNSGARELRTATDSTGSYVLAGIPQGELVVSARGIGYYSEQRRIAFGECGVRIVDSAGASGHLEGFNPVTCRAEQWLAFFIRPRPVF